MERDGRIPKFHLQSIRLQTQEHEWPNTTIALENRCDTHYLHRELPDDAEIKTVTVKREPTGKWYAILSVKTPDDPPEKPETPEQCVSIDFGILKYAHDTGVTVVGSLDLSDERERLERAQRNLSRKEYGSNNLEKQRRFVAERHADLKNMRYDFLHKLSNHYAREYDLIAVDDLNAAGLVELPGNSRNRAGSA